MQNGQGGLSRVPGAKEGGRRFSGKHSPLAVVRVTSRATVFDNMRTKWIECVRTRVPKYVIVHSKRAKRRCEGTVISSSLEPFAEESAEEMVASVVNGERRPGLLGELIKTFLKGFHYWRLFCGKKVVECLVLKKLGLTAEESLT